MRDENNRSRYGDWRRDLTSRGYVRSDSYPNFFTTQSKNIYLRDSSNLGDKVWITGVIQDLVIIKEGIAIQD